MQMERTFKPSKPFFIGVDSDGCVFDSMELKHKECFCPAVIKHWKLQAVSRIARETWEFVNLYSRTRGCNRFLALIHLFHHLENQREVVEAGVSLPDLSPLIAWTGQESKLGNATLEAYLKEYPNDILERAYQWSCEVNANIAAMDTVLPPFPQVGESLDKAKACADIMVVSQTPVATLEHEWRQNGLDSRVQMIAGQEQGTKQQHIEQATAERYEANRVLMIGDAPGDLAAAKANGVLFYPVVPGSERSSWQRFSQEALDRFFAGSYQGAYEDERISEFESSLPEKPTWNEDK